MSIPNVLTATPSGELGATAAAQPNASLSAPEPAPPSIEETLAKYRHEALIIAQYFPGSALAVIAGGRLSTKVSAGGFRTYLVSILRACGNPRDPLEAMMVEQLVQAHFRISDLHAQSAAAPVAEVAAAYNAAASRLMAEFRRSTLALKASRTGAATKRAIEKPQDMSAAANSNTAAADALVNPKRAGEKMHDTKLGTKSEPSNDDRPTTDSSANSGAAEPLKTQRTKPRWAPEAERNGHGEPPLEILNGTPNGRG